jgi:hypothetical protein
MSRINEKDTNKIPYRKLSPSRVGSAPGRRGLGGGFLEAFEAKKTRQARFIGLQVGQDANAQNAKYNPYALLGIQRGGRYMYCGFPFQVDK